MKNLLWITMAFLIALPVALVLAGQMGLLSGTAPTDLGVNAERLKPPSLTRNSVSSQAALHPEHPQLAYANIAPLTLLGASQTVAMAQLLNVLKADPGVQITLSQADYIRATARTPLMGFVDDLEFWFNPALGVIELRSASRLGSEDMGANRQRMERIRSAYNTATAPVGQ